MISLSFRSTAISFNEDLARASPMYPAGWVLQRSYIKRTMYECVYRWLSARLTHWSYYSLALPHSWLTKALIHAPTQVWKHPFLRILDDKPSPLSSEYVDIEAQLETPVKENCDLFSLYKIIHPVCGSQNNLYHTEAIFLCTSYFSLGLMYA